MAAKGWTKCRACEGTGDCNYCLGTGETKTLGAMEECPMCCAGECQQCGGRGWIKPPEPQKQTKHGWEKRK